jgi:hypothetical protein
MKLNRISLAVVVVLGAVVFGMVFWRQIGVNIDRLADAFAQSDYGPYSPSAVAGAAVVNVPAKTDDPTQLDRELNSMNLDLGDDESQALEAQIKELQ